MRYLLFILCFTTLNAAFSSPLDFMMPSINSSVATNYCIENNNFEYLETMTVSVKSPKLFLFFDVKQKNGLFTEVMNQLKKEARDKYGNNVAFINTTKVERNNLTIIFPILYTQEIIISADIIKFIE